MKILFFPFLLFSFVTLAQKIEVGAGIGGLHYKGDISPNFHPSFVKPGANIFFRYNLSRSMSFKAQGMIGGFGADETKVNDPLNQARGMSFTTKVAEAGIQAEYNFLTYKNTRQSRNFSPYLFAGVALASTRSTNSVTGTTDRLPLVIPFGVAMKGQIRGSWGWGAEFGTRKTFSDYLDNFGQDSFPNSQNRLSQADYTSKDMYYFTTFSISYTFYKVVCPD